MSLFTGYPVSYVSTLRYGDRYLFIGIIQSSDRDMPKGERFPGVEGRVAQIEKDKYNVGWQVDADREIEELLQI